jgi:hypothetical protein
MKSRYMAPDQPGYEKQKKFDDKLASMKLFEFSRYGPPADEFLHGLQAANVADLPDPNLDFSIPVSRIVQYQPKTVVTKI